MENHGQKWLGMSAEEGQGPVWAAAPKEEEERTNNVIKVKSSVFLGFMLSWKITLDIKFFVGHYWFLWDY